MRAQGRTFVLVGTAHVSRESAELVRSVIESERPDAVAVELDERRYAALSDPQQFERLDLREILRQRQMTTLLLQLVLAGYQRSLGLRLGVQPGTELLEAARVAQAGGIPVSLCDRDVRITLRRAWHRTSAWRKLLLLSSLVAGTFARPSIDEDALRELREKDALSSLLDELGDAFPSLKHVLIDERDAYLAERLRATEGERVVAVVGAGHRAGIARALREPEPVDLAALETVPPPSRIGRRLGWAIPVVILGSLVGIGLRHGAQAAGENLVFWGLANAVPCAIGAALALAHPATVAAAFVSAPLTSLTPVIGAGYVTAFVQTWLRPPVVRELREVSADAARPAGWWRNRLLRVFLVFLLTTLGSLIGTWVGGAELVSNLF